MTLVQLLIDERSLHMSCDFRLTNAETGSVLQDSAHKLVNLRRRSAFAGLVGVTGLGHVDGVPVGAWIALLDQSGGDDETYDAFLRRLAGAATVGLSRIVDDVLRRHTFVVGAILGSQTVVSIVSNFEQLVDGRVVRQAEAGQSFKITSLRPKGPQLILAGALDSLSPTRRSLLTTTLRAGSSHSSIQLQLSKSNAEISSTYSTVSVGCHVASLDITGKGSSQPFLTDAQKGDFIPPDAQVAFDQIGIRLKRATGPDGNPLPIQLVSSTSTAIVNSQKYFDEQLKLLPNDPNVWNNYGAFLSAKGRNTEAISAFETALNLDDSHVTAIVNLADQTWIHLKDAVTAEGLYSRALALSEPATPTWILSSYAQMCEHVLNDSIRARQSHEQAARRPDFPLAKARYALFLLENGGDQSTAEQHLAEALELEPANSGILTIAGDVAWRFHGDLRVACERLHAACLGDGASAQTFRIAADLTLHAEDYVSSSYYYKKAISRGTPTWSTECGYGLVLLAQGKPDGALRHLRRALALAPDELPVRINFVAATWASGQRHEATKALRDLLRTGALASEFELELLAMLKCTTFAGQGEEARYRQLLADGVSTDTKTLQAMFRGGTANERARAAVIAREIGASA